MIFPRCELKAGKSLMVFEKGIEYEAFLVKRKK